MPKAKRPKAMRPAHSGYDELEDGRQPGEYMQPLPSFAAKSVAGGSLCLMFCFAYNGFCLMATSAMIDQAIVWMAVVVFGVYTPITVLLCLKIDRQQVGREHAISHSPRKVQILARVNVVVQCGCLYWLSVILVLWNVLWYPSVQPTHVFARMPLWWTLVTVPTIVLCMAAFVAMIVKVLLQTMTLLEERFDTFIDTIECASGEIDWDKLAVDVNLADVQAAEMLNMTHVGSLVVLNVVSGGMIMAMTTWVMLVAPPSSALFGIAAYGFVLGVGQAFGVLFLLANLTSIVKDVAVMAWSVHSAARRYPAHVIDDMGHRQDKGRALAHTDPEPPLRRRVSQMSNEEKAAHRGFMAFITFSPLGAEVFGVRISKQLLAQQVAKVAVLVPTFIGVIRQTANRALHA